MTADDGREWTYHGVQGRLGGPVTVRVEESSAGPTQRQNVQVLRELLIRGERDFRWGYDGDGPANTSEAVIADALELGPPEEVNWTAEPGLPYLVQDFTADFLVEACDEWRLPRRTVLHWLAWYEQSRGVRVPAPGRGGRGH